MESNNNNNNNKSNSNVSWWGVGCMMVTPKCERLRVSRGCSWVGLEVK